jgi:ribosomal protein L31E
MEERVRLLTSFRVTMDEAYAIGELLKEAHRDKGTKAIVIDNREAKGAWTQEVNKVWMDVSLEVSNEKPKKVVTLTSDVIAAMQINRLSKSNGAEQISKAFCSDFNEEVKAFIYG